MELHKLTAHEARDMLAAGKISSRELTEAVISQIERVEGYVNSFITRSFDLALANADKVDKAFSDGEDLPDLAGIPMGLKDNICTEGVRTTCASRMLENFIPPYGATVASRLSEQKSIMMGKLNMDEFAIGSSTESSAIKKTANPWDLSRIPGGSSGGSAAAVAADQVIYSLGSDTGGSIRQPASLCGVVGMKPTYGLVSRFGLVAYASSLDQIGPITKDVTDCALLLNAIAGYDPMDATSANSKQQDYTRALVDNVDGFKIGIPKEYFGMELNSQVRESVEKAIRTFEEMGAQIDEISMPFTDYALPAYYIIASAEASSNLARYDGIKYGYRAKEFDDLVDLYKKTRSEGFGAEVKRIIMLGNYALSSEHYEAYYLKALKVRTLIKQEFDKVFEKYDMLLSPTSPATASKIGEKAEDPMEMYISDIYTVPANIAGIPALTIPCGFDGRGLPIGLQLIGKPFDEAAILQAAYTFEQNTDFHTKHPALEVKV